MRIAAPAPEPHIDCPAVRSSDVPPDTYLRASPELQMKKLLAAGMDRIYQIGPCFCEGERGSRHSPEFTMIEWYRRNAGYLDIAADLESLLSALPGFRAPLPFRRLTVREAYRNWAGWDPWTAWDSDRFEIGRAHV